MRLERPVLSGKGASQCCPRRRQVGGPHARLPADGGDACQIGNPPCIRHLLLLATAKLLVAIALRKNRLYALSLLQNNLDMPTPRVSCSQCRAAKAKCSYIPGDQSCTRCAQRRVLCELPGHRVNSTQEPSANGSDGSNLQTGALNERIGKIEKLLVELKSAMPISARKTDHRNHSVDESTKLGSSMPTPAVEQPSVLATRCSLPPMEEGQALLTEYLREFNNTVPLLVPEAIVSHMRDCYSGAAKGVASSWVLTYFVFGIAHRLRALDPSVRSEETFKTEQYLDKCLSSFSNVLLEEPNERIVQCLLGIAIMLQDSPKSHRVSSFVSIALRMAQELGYNEASISGSNQKVTGYLFWIAFSMDANLSMCALRPNTQKYEGISISLPHADDNDWWGLRTDNDDRRTNGPVEINFFFLNCSLAIVQAQALEEVFSPKANLQPVQYNFALHTVISKLAAWRRDSRIDSAEGLPSSELLHLAMLEASYFRTMYQFLAAQQIGVVGFRYDLFSHAVFQLLNHSQPARKLYEDARKLLNLLASPPIGILSLNR